VRLAVDISSLEADLLSSCGIDGTKSIIVQLGFKNGLCASLDRILCVVQPISSFSLPLLQI
jgi:hypothetical protein